jgi:hypothetical protein
VQSQQELIISICKRIEAKHKNLKSEKQKKLLAEIAKEKQQEAKIKKWKSK